MSVYLRQLPELVMWSGACCDLFHEMVCAMGFLSFFLSLNNVTSEIVDDPSIPLSNIKKHTFCFQTMSNSGPSTQRVQHKSKRLRIAAALLCCHTQRDHYRALDGQETSALKWQQRLQFASSPTYRRSSATRQCVIVKAKLVRGQN